MSDIIVPCEKFFNYGKIATIKFLRSISSNLLIY